MNLESFNYIIGSLGLLAMATFLLVILSLILRSTSSYANCLVKHIKKNHLGLTLLFALMATIGSLSYSDYFMLSPCKLCWYQRIFMYPIVLIALIGGFLKDPKAGVYSLWLALCGALISLYQLYLQFVATGYSDCAIVGQNANCSKVWIKVFDFMTIPSMALICFVAIITVNVINLKAK